MQQAGVAVTFAMKLGSRFIEQCAMDWHVCLEKFLSHGGVLVG